MTHALVAENAATPAEALAELASNYAGGPDPRVRLRVAGNGATPVATLAELAGDPDPGVRLRVAGNVATLLEDLTPPSPRSN